MIQRKQTVFLLLAFVLFVVTMTSRLGMLVSNGIEVAQVYCLWLTDAAGHHAMASWPLLALLIIAAILSLVTILMYSRRILQSRLCLVLMLLVVCWYIFLAVLPQQTGGSLMLEWPVVLPMISVILTFMARRGIIADEKLVRSLDRIR